MELDHDSVYRIDPTDRHRVLTNPTFIALTDGQSRRAVRTPGGCPVEEGHRKI